MTVTSVGTDPRPLLLAGTLTQGATSVPVSGETRRASQLPINPPIEPGLLVSVLREPRCVAPATSVMP